MRILTVERYDKGTFLTSEGIFNWDFDGNGDDGILICEENGEAINVISINRDDSAKILAITVE